MQLLLSDISQIQNEYNTNIICVYIIKFTQEYKDYSVCDADCPRELFPNQA